MKRNVWLKATDSDEAGQCVEVMATEENILVRDSKDQGAGPIHTYSHSEWMAFLSGAKKGEFDL